jgi:predicted alternative tryptophan synthase beta-subunit
MTAEDNHPESNVSAFTANLSGLLRAVDLCLQEQLVLPTLALIYTAIDVVSALERTDTDRNTLRAKGDPPGSAGLAVAVRHFRECSSVGFRP